MLLEKSPPNLVRTRFLQALFPASWFIVITRHPLATSIATRNFVHEEMRLDRLLRHWFVCHERFEEDAPHLERVLQLRYEDFADEPQEVLHRIHDFVGVPRRPLDRTVRSGANDKYVDAWRATTQRSLARRIAAEVLVRRYERQANHFGYSLRDFAS